MDLPLLGDGRGDEPVRYHHPDTEGPRVVGDGGHVGSLVAGSEFVAQAVDPPYFGCLVRREAFPLDGNEGPRDDVVVRVQPRHPSVGGKDPDVGLAGNFFRRGRRIVRRIHEYRGPRLDLLGFPGHRGFPGPDDLGQGGQGLRKLGDRLVHVDLADLPADDEIQGQDKEEEAGTSPPFGPGLPGGVQGGPYPQRQCTRRNKHDERGGQLEGLRVSLPQRRKPVGQGVDPPQEECQDGRGGAEDEKAPSPGPRQDLAQAGNQERGDSRREGRKEAPPGRDGAVLPAGLHGRHATPPPAGPRRSARPLLRRFP